MKTYLEYLSQVLGLESVMMPTPIHAMDPTTILLTKPAFFYSAQGVFDENNLFKKCDLAIVNWVHEPEASLFDKKTADLFGKMFAAMKLSAEKALILDCVMNERNLIPNELFKICEAKYVLFFSAEPDHLSEMQMKGSSNWLETFSPSYLLMEPTSKKIVWNDMQKIMKEIKKENSWNS